MRNKKIVIVLLLFQLSFNLFTIHATVNEQEAYNLLDRIVPAYNGKVLFQEHSSESDFFELSMVEDKVLIKGNSTNSMAVGLNYYLKYVCKTSVSWNAYDNIIVPDTLPVPKKVIRHKALVHNRFMLNYCTFGYSMLWWKWNDWERLIDWMALNGINMPLALTGQESIWLEVWKELGLDEEYIKHYFTGPAYLSWHRMGNLDSWLGGLSDSWLNSQKELQLKILKRVRSLNMTPILPAFSGHVPEKLKKLYPNANIVRMNTWGGFPDQYRTSFLHPLDPLFSKIQRLFIKKQNEVYGSNHVYAVDPFNELINDNWGPEYLSSVSSAIYNSLKKVDEKAVWLQMTWAFYYGRKYWTDDCIKSYLEAIPAEGTILLDYFAEHKEVWRFSNAYYNHPFIWCYLGNFGGATFLQGNFKETNLRINQLFKEKIPNFSGIGLTMEGLDVNPIMYEYTLEKAWDYTTEDDTWIKSWADRRIGYKSESTRKLWDFLINNVYDISAESSRATLTNARPTLEGKGELYTRFKIGYSNKELFKYWKNLDISHQNLCRDSYLFDVVNIGRQVLGNHFIVLRDSFASAYKEKNLPKGQLYANKMMKLFDDLDELLSLHPSFSFDKWINDASVCGANLNEKKYYRLNARSILTAWGYVGQSLNDYANRTWSGLTKSYYKERWRIFIEDILHSIETNVGFDENAFNIKLKNFEENFIQRDKALEYSIHKIDVNVIDRIRNTYIEIE